MPAMCRDCEFQFESGARCPTCFSPRIIVHPELHNLNVAHIDCDAFYAAIEKRDDPSIRDKPVIVGGSRRGVVTTACYIARIHGVRSAMPMFRARQLCPEAVVIRPRMNEYAAASRDIRRIMTELTPAVEPISLDEAFLDFAGTRRLHAAPASILLVRLANKTEQELGITVSVGLSHNKFLAKIASDLDKPRGFSIIGRHESEDFLIDRPVSLIWGVGPVLTENLKKEGIISFRDLKRFDQAALHDKFGSIGGKLWHLARGRDARPVLANRVVKSISNEMTLEEDQSDRDILLGHIWRLSEKVSSRAKANSYLARVITLKVKRANHAIITRRTSLESSTQMADRIFDSARNLFLSLGKPSSLRLIGVGLGGLTKLEEGNTVELSLDPKSNQRIKAELAADKIKRKFGKDAILKGRALR